MTDPSPSPSSLESEALTSPLSAPDSDAPGRLNLSGSADPSSPSGSPTRDAGATCGDAEAPKPGGSFALYGPTNKAGERTFHELETARQVTASFTAQQQGLLCSPGVSHARISPSPGSAEGSPGDAQGSSTKSSASRKSSGRRGASSRMFQGSLALPGDQIWGSSSRDYGNAGLLSATGFWTAVTSESPSAVVESSLSAVLMKRVSPRYSLSPKAAAGILRRAKKRGRELLQHLLAA